MKRKLMTLMLTLVMAFAMTAVAHADAFNNTMGTAQSIANADVTQSVFYPDDKIDWYKFTLEKDSFVTIVAQAKTSNVGFYLNDGTDEDGFKFVSVETAGGTYGYYGQLNGCSLKAGTYYIKFIDVNPGPQGTGYEFQFTYKVDTSATPEGCAAKGHPFVNSAVTKKGTCSQFGETTLSCKCGQNKQVVKNSVAKDPSNHDGIMQETVVPATCEKAETHKKVCSACKKTVETTTVGDTLPHDFSRKFVYDVYKKSDATCTSPAIYYYQCKECGTASEEKTFSSGSKLSHTYTKVDCETYECKNCTATMSTGKKHDWTGVVCTGLKCSACTATKAATGHKWAAATCTAPKTCGECKATEGTVADHTEVVVPGKAATTTSVGYTDGKKCSVCQKVTVAQQEIPKLPVAETPSTKPSTGEFGTVTPTPTPQPSPAPEQTPAPSVVAIQSVKVAKASVAYTGKAQKVAVTVKDANGKVVSAANYTVTYKNNVKVGKATVTVKGKGNYAGTKTATFKIIPKATKVTKVTGAKRAATVKWTKVAKEVTGYEVMVATNKKFNAGKKTVTVKKANAVSAKVTKLKAKKTYYVKVRAYKTVGKVKYYSNWSAVKQVKVK